MADILGVGITHYPPLLGMPDTYADLLRLILTSPRVPERLEDPSAWPEPMQREYAEEHANAEAHQARHRAALAEVRARIDAFEPDAVIIFGDDQYENFQESVIPPFNVYCMDAFESRPFAAVRGANIWGVESDYTYTLPGAGRLARDLASTLIEDDCPVAYSYRPLHHQTLTHAFANALVFLDWDQRGWPYPIVPISVNCYGTSVIHARGAFAQLLDRRPEGEKDPYLDRPGPAGPTPRSCFGVGAAVRRALDDLDGRYVIMASSGWSHGFLTAKHHWLYPDQAFDRERLAELEAGQQRRWAELGNAEIEGAGSHEFKNWICLAGAVAERRPRIIDYLETWIFNSQKCFAIFEPEAS